MPAENLEEQGLEKNPNLELAQAKYLLTLSEFQNDEQTIEKMLDAVRKDCKYFYKLLLPLIT